MALRPLLTLREKGEAFVVGLQGHPETHWQAAEPRWRRLFAALVAAARQTATPSLRAA